MSAFNLPNTATGVFDPGFDRSVNQAQQQQMQMPGYNADPMGLSGFPGLESTFFDMEGRPTGVRFGPQGPFDPTGRPQYGGLKQGLGESLDVIRDLALSGEERLAEIDASKEAAGSALEEGFGAQQETLTAKATDIAEQRELGLQDLTESSAAADKLLKDSERKASRKLKSAGRASAAATAIDAGRRAGEQTKMLKSQFSASGMSGPQQIEALRQADAPRAAETAAQLNRIRADVAQGESQIALSVGQARSTLAAATGQSKASFRQSMTEMYGGAQSELAASQGRQGEVLAQLETTYQQMKSTDRDRTAAFNQQFGGALATGSTTLAGIFNNIGPGVDFRTLGLDGDLFEFADFVEA